MGLSNFQKKRYYIMPDKDYNKGPITDYGTFGNMIKQKIKGGIKEASDDLIGSLTGYTPEQIKGLSNASLNAMGEPIDEEGNTIQPKGKANPFGFADFGYGTVKTISKAPKLMKGDVEDFVFRNDEVLDAIDNYVDDGYLAMNKSMKEGKDGGWLYKKLKPLFEIEGNHTGKVGRGTYLNKKDLMNLKEGDLIDNRMVLSTSKDPSIYENFTRVRDKSPDKIDGTRVPTIIEFDLRQPKGYDISSFGSHAEDEVLIPPNQLMQVSKVHKNPNGSYKLDLYDVADEIRDIIADRGGKASNSLMSIGGAVCLGSMLNKGNSDD